MTSTLHRIATPDNAEADVIFVHGLGGDPFTTWQLNKGHDPKDSWLYWLAAANNNVAVYSLQYEAQPSAWLGSALSLVDRATEVLKILEIDDVGKRPIIWVTHSLGGLLVKQILRHADDQNKEVSKQVIEQTRSILFFATPHAGANLANWLIALGKISRPTSAAANLKAHDEQLSNLNNWFRSEVLDRGFQIECFFETEATKGVTVVNRTSADPGIADVVPIPIEGADHLQICKPENERDLRCRLLLKIIKDTLNNRHKRNGTAEPETAQRHLASMPTDNVPEPGSFPANYSMPSWPIHDFVGREADLKYLASVLKEGTTAAIGQIAATTGMGGIGKTQLALAFAHRYGQYFLGGVYWVSFADAEAVPTKVDEVFKAMFPKEGFDKKSPEEQRNQIVEAWKSPLPRLLVFDNCEDEGLLQTWRPASGGARILITSRRQRWPQALGIEQHPLGVFSRKESLELLLKHRPGLEADDPDLNEIADRLGDLPLALHLAGSYLKKYKHEKCGEPKFYLAELEKPYFLGHQSLIEGEISPTDHEQHVGRTFQLSYERLNPCDELDDLAVDLLARASCFAPGQEIPRFLLFASVGIEDGDDAKTCVDALKRLLEHGLLYEQDDGRLVLHRLLALFVRHRIDNPSAAQTAVEKTVQAEASKINISGSPGPLVSWQDHLHHVAWAASERKSDLADELLTTLGIHLSCFANYKSALSAFEQALKISENNYCADHPVVATRLNNLARSFRSIGRIQEAKDCLERAYNIALKKFNPHHPKIAFYLSGLGGIFLDNGEFQKAKNYFKQAYDIDNLNSSSNCRTISTRLNNLGNAYLKLEELDTAKHCFCLALKIDEKIYGAEHLNVATVLNNLASTLINQGDGEGARVHLQRTLEIREAELGHSHPDTIQVRNKLTQLS